MKKIAFLSILLICLTVGTASAGFVTVHPHVGNMYWIGADGHQISLINNGSSLFCMDIIIKTNAVLS